MSARNNLPKMREPQTVVLPGESEGVCYDPDLVEQHQIGTTTAGKPILQPPARPTSRRPDEAAPSTTWTY
jgi:hypothetical protein